MAGVRYPRRDFAGKDRGAMVEIVDQERTIRLFTSTCLIRVF
jgi:hypothetical protein